MDLEDITVFGFVLLGFLGVIGGMHLLTHVPRMARTVRSILLLILIFIDSSIAERVCRVVFHDQARGAIWTRVFLITLIASSIYIFALIARERGQPVMSPPDTSSKKERKE